MPDPESDEQAISGKQGVEGSMDRARLRVLLVDDQPAVVQALSVLFDLHGIPFVTAAEPGDAERIAREEPLGAVVQDMNFRRNETEGAAGVELFHTIRNAQPGVPILLMTAWASLETAVELMREGAADYIEKPWDDDRLVATVRNLVRMRELEIENRDLRSELKESRNEGVSERARGRARSARNRLCQRADASRGQPRGQRRELRRTGNDHRAEW